MKKEKFPQSRRAAVHPALWALLVPVVVLALTVGLIALQKKEKSLPDGAQFSVNRYLDAPENFLGNRYVQEVRVEEQLEWKKGVGRLLCVRLLDAPKGEQTLVPLFVPQQVAPNIELNQRLRVAFEVGESGLLGATAVEKI